MCADVCFVAFSFNLFCHMIMWPQLSVFGTFVFELSTLIVEKRQHGGR